MVSSPKVHSFSVKIKEVARGVFIVLCYHPKKLELAVCYSLAFS